MKLLQSHRRFPWLTATIGVNITFILVAVSEEYFTASLSKVNYAGTSAERRPMMPVAQYFKYVTTNFISSDFANSQL